MDLLELHEKLCHPWLACMVHFVHIWNLPYSVDDVKNAISQCSFKPQLYRPEKLELIWTMHLFDRLSIDSKGSLPLSSLNEYLLIVEDYYLQFPFSFACKDTSSSTAISCLMSLLTIFSLPGYIHSDRGSLSMPSQVKSFLHSRCAYK